MMNSEVETTKKRFQCLFCEYSSDRKYDLIRHEGIHTGKKPFKCKHCEYSSNQKDTLIKHERIHTGEKPFKCKDCDKSFADRSALVKHERLHTGEKPYSCNHCKKSFTTSSGLNHHKKKCTDFVIKQEPSTKSDVNPDNEVHHNVTDTTENHQMFDQSENICEETVFIALASNQDVKEEIIEDVKTECSPHMNNVFTCDVCQEVFSEKVVLFMHKDLNHS